MHDSVPLHIQGLTKRFRRKPDRRKGDTAAARSPRVAALSAVSLELSRGEIYGLVGPNGCGKSTLVRIVSTLLLPDEGRATVFGRDVVREAAVVRRLVNRVSVEASFFKKLSANENLLYAARLYGLEPEVAARRAAQILEQLGFPMRRTRESMENLSRGQQQKVAIARGLFTSPVLLLLDEPSTGLDPRSKREVQAFVRSTVDDQDATVLFTTHDMEEANRICHRVGIMVGGRIVAEGAPEELRARCRDDAHPEPTLEDVFLRLTGKSLEEEEASAVAAGAEQ